jgi:hypothetical protein
LAVALDCCAALDADSGGVALLVLAVMHKMRQEILD